jgi:hypothetical protein
MTDTANLAAAPYGGRLDAVRARLSGLRNLPRLIGFYLRRDDGAHVVAADNRADHRFDLFAKPRFDAGLAIGNRRGGSGSNGVGISRCGGGIAQQHKAEQRRGRAEHGDQQQLRLPVLLQRFQVWRFLGLFHAHTIPDF